jgi:hypothetical protein
VVEHARHVLDPVRSFRQPQHQLVVLHAVERRIEAADAFDEAPPHDEQVPDVHHAAEELRGPVGLEERMAEPAAAVDLVLVGVDDIRVRLLVQHADALEQRVVVELVVVVEEGDELPLGRRERPVGGGGDARVGLAEADLDSRLAGDGVEVVERLAACGAVVGEDELPVRIGLPAHRLDRTLQPGRIGVEDRREDRDDRPDSQRLVRAARCRPPHGRRTGDGSRAVPPGGRAADPARQASGAARTGLRRAQRKSHAPRHGAADAREVGLAGESSCLERVALELEPVELMAKGVGFLPQRVALGGTLGRRPRRLGHPPL